MNEASELRCKSIGAATALLLMAAAVLVMAPYMYTLVFLLAAASAAVATGPARRRVPGARAMVVFSALFVCAALALYAGTAVSVVPGEADPATTVLRGQR